MSQMFKWFNRQDRATRFVLLAWPFAILFGAISWAIGFSPL